MASLQPSLWIQVSTKALSQWVRKELPGLWGWGSDFTAHTSHHGHFARPYVHIPPAHLPSSYCKSILLVLPTAQSWCHGCSVLWNLNLRCPQPPQSMPHPLPAGDQPLYLPSSLPPASPRLWTSVSSYKLNLLNTFPLYAFLTRSITTDFNLSLHYLLPQLL